jgi:hypothetical protein
MHLHSRFCCTFEVADVSSHRVELPFVHHRHELDPDQNTPRIVEGLETEHRLDPCLYSAMVLLNDVIEVLTGTNLDRVFPPVVELVSHAHAA